MLQIIDGNKSQKMQVVSPTFGREIIDSHTFGIVQSRANDESESVDKHC